MGATCSNPCCSKVPDEEFASASPVASPKKATDEELEDHLSTSFGVAAAAIAAEGARLQSEELAGGLSSERFGKSSPHNDSPKHDSPKHLPAPDSTVGEVTTAASSSALTSTATSNDDYATLLEEAVRAAAECRYEAAIRAHEGARALLRERAADAAPPIAADPLLGELAGRMARVRRMKEDCRPHTEKGWKHYELELCTMWRTWDSKTGALKLVIQWDAVGSLTQHIAALRDADVCEPQWNGACWSMTSQHAKGASLVRWLQKDPFTGRKTEVLMERTLCDCLDDDQRPGWVLLERSPDVKGLETFSGTYGSFEIGPPPDGFIRSVFTECGRVLEPLGEDKVRVTMVLEVLLPSIIRWAVTDSLLVFAARTSSKSAQQSWAKIHEEWDALGYDERIQKEAEFYEPVSARIAAYLRDRRGQS